MVATSIAARADSPSQPIPADGKCNVPGDANWTKQEQFVWMNVCIGKVADFNKAPGYGDDLDPKSPAGLPESRILRSSFLETILLKDKYRGALTRLGVNIAGARFTETVDLGNAELQDDLSLDKCLFEKDVDLNSTKSPRGISVSNSKLLGGFYAYESQINEDLLMNKSEFHAMNIARAYIGKRLSLTGSAITNMLYMYQIHAGEVLMQKATFNGINLASAYVNGDLVFSNSTDMGVLNMSGLRVEGDVSMDGMTLVKEISLVSAHISGALVLNGSGVANFLNMNGLRVDRSLLMRDKAQFEDIDLIGANIGGELILSSSTVAGILNMNQIHVEQPLFMRENAKFTEINLAGAQIDELDLSSSTVTDMLDMGQIRVHQSVRMREANLTEINLAVAYIGGQLDLSRSMVTGKLEGYSIDVEQTMFLGRGTIFEKEIDLSAAKIGKDLLLSGSTFNGPVNLTGSQIRGVLQLESTEWPGNSTLTLSDAAVDGIDLSHNWPDKIYLNGLTYRNLTNLAHEFSLTQAETWFGKQPYAPQPYQQLASVLQSNGWISDATAIRYAGKERERQIATGWNWAWLFLLNYSIGFGYHLEFALYWAIGLVFLGWAVLYSTGQRTKHGITLGMAYSLEMLIPIVHLRKKHDEIDLDPWPRRYFFVHKILGVILTSFIVAGISGLTK